MLITKKSVLTGVIREREIDVTDEQLELWNSGVLIQYAMPHLSPDDREFLMTGITPEEWDETFGEDDSTEL